MIDGGKKLFGLIAIVCRGFNYNAPHQIQKNAGFFINRKTRLHSILYVINIMLMLKG